MTGEWLRKLDQTEFYNHLEIFVRKYKPFFNFCIYVTLAHNINITRLGDGLCKNVYIQYVHHRLLSPTSSMLHAWPEMHGCFAYWSVSTTATFRKLRFRIAGVAELLRSRYFEWLIYIHCTAHHLNLVVNDLIKKSVFTTNVISMLNSLSIFLNLPKVRPVYEQLYRDLYKTNQVKHLCQQIDIRWGCNWSCGFCCAKIDVFWQP